MFFFFNRLFFILLICTVAYGEEKIILYDPTTPLSPNAIDERNPDTNLILQAIFFSPIYSYVIINGSVVSPGQKIGAFTLLSISKESVQLQGESGIVTLLLLDQTVKSTEN